MSDIRLQDDGTTQIGGLTIQTPIETDADQSVSVDDFLQLMIAQLTNQDFMNPVDDTQYVTQLAQFSSMEAMQELSYYSQTNYVSSMLGKTVTAASYGIGGSVSQETGIVSKVNLSGDEFTFTVNGKEFLMSQIMTLDEPSAGAAQSQLDNAGNIALIGSNITNDSTQFTWQSPVDDTALSQSLTYDVYYTSNTSANFNELSSVKQGTKAATGLKTLEYELTGLLPGTEYQVNVVVRDEAGNEAIFQKLGFTTTGTATT